MSTDRSFLKNSFITFTRQVSNIVIGMLLLSVLGKYLGDEGFGNYTILTLFPTVLLTFLTLGVNTSTIYFVSRKEVDLNTVFNNNIIIGTLLSIISILVGLIAVMFFSEQLFKDAPIGLVYLSLLSVPFLFLREYFQTVFQGLQDFKAFNTLMVQNQLSILSFAVLFVIVLDLGLRGALSAFILGNAITVVTMIWKLIRHHQVSFRWNSFSWEYFRKSVNYGLKAHVSNFASFLNYRTVVFILSYFTTGSAVGRYSAAMNLGERLSIFAVSFSSVLYPKISSTNSEADRNRITSIVSRNVFLITILMAATVFFMTDFIVFTIFNEGYVETPLLLKIMLPGFALLAVEKVLSNDIAGRGRPELNMWLSIYNVIFNVILNLFMVPKFGVTGAAVSTTITYFFSFILKIVIFKRLTGESYSNFLLIKKSDFLIYKTLLQKIRAR
ncbi:flippase [Fictibacillus nanhaiensis]|uniref:flippase n=1 Tax=Fictibacillus nanhaiensis TaxID=742169 RepID=UPI001C985BC4|nr:flippase [Fictibacillus nanhaiensis]MBY6037088.1 flippase [Fictibacillus nanhaiensis]